MTLIEKILANNSGQKKVEPGEIVNAKIDVAMVHEITGPRSKVENLCLLHRVV